MNSVTRLMVSRLMIVGLCIGLSALNFAHATSQHTKFCSSQVVESQSELTEFCQALQPLMPRLGSVSEVFSTANAEYVVFNHNGNELWVYSRQQQAVRLLEVATNQGSAVDFAPQWSADGRWLLFTSFKPQNERPRVFSVEKKRHYALPIKTSEYSTLAWSGSTLSIGVRDFAGKDSELARFKALGIALTTEDYSQTLAKR
jgi:hypothetical protein